MSAKTARTALTANKMLTSDNEFSVLTFEMRKVGKTIPKAAPRGILTPEIEVISVLCLGKTD